jgi:hypothetical protein
MIRAQEQAGEIPNLVYRMPAGVGGGFNHHLIGTLANNRASLSFVTGAHNMKFGYQGGFNNPSQTYQHFNEINFVRLRDGVPNQPAGHTTIPGPHQGHAQPLADLFLRAGSGDQRSADLQGGIRYDWYLANYPESRIGGPGYAAVAAKEIVYPARSTQGISWQDVTPRMGVAYDVFGNGKTAVKFNLGKYMQANSAANNDLDLNPIIRTAISTTRGGSTPTRFRGELRAGESGEERECAMDKNLGKEVFDRLRHRLTEGWACGYNWGWAFVQQEAALGVSVNAGYFATGGELVLRQPGKHDGGLTPFSITAPVDARARRWRSTIGACIISCRSRPQGGFVRDQFQDLREQSENCTASMWASAAAERAHGAGWHEHRPQARIRRVSGRRAGWARGDDHYVAAGSQNPHCRVVEPFRTDIRDSRRHGSRSTSR